MAWAPTGGDRGRRVEVVATVCRAWRKWLLVEDYVPAQLSWRSGRECCRLLSTQRHHLGS